MSTRKITEKEVTTRLEDEAHFLVTQKENGTEVLRRLETPFTIEDGRFYWLIDEEEEE